MKDAEHRELALRALGVLIERANSLLVEEMALDYKGLAGRIGYPGPLSGRRFGVEIGKTLRFMAALLDGPAVNGRQVPRIQCLVVRRDTGVPGAGFFRQPLPRLSEARVLARAERDRVAAFGAARWRRVLLRARSRAAAAGARSCRCPGLVPIQGRRARVEETAPCRPTVPWILAL